MIGLIEQKRQAIVELCRQYRVKRLEVFGSALSADGFDLARSDLDFLVEFLPLVAGGHADAYFGLLEGMRISSGTTLIW